MEVQNWKKHSANCLWNASFPDKEPVWFSITKVALIKISISSQIYFWQRYCQAIYDMNGKQVAFLQQ
jgi:hypothetical protein